MNPFVDNVTAILNRKKISKNKLLTDLNLSKNSFVDWKKRGTIPSASVVSAIAEYLNVDTSVLLNKESSPTIFKKKLKFLMDTECMTEETLCAKLNISMEEYHDWMTGESTSYVNYYGALSSIFNVMEKYFYTKNVIAPGIEPTEDEYDLLVLYKSYKNNYPLEYCRGLDEFFPTYVFAKTEDEKKLLNVFSELNSDNQIILMGEALKLSKEQRQFESVAADEVLKSAK